jgi:hypothetical protein
MVRDLCMRVFVPAYAADVVELVPYAVVEIPAGAVVGDAEGAVRGKRGACGKKDSAPRKRASCKAWVSSKPNFKLRGRGSGCPDVDAARRDEEKLKTRVAF